MRMELLTQNSKIKLSEVRTFNFGLPAGETCPNAGDCLQGCYALAGAYRFSNVRACFQSRYELTHTDAFIDLMVREIQCKRAVRIRIHDSGDFYSDEYLDRWLVIIKRLPHVQFYAYTKQVAMFKARGKLPANFTVVYSFGGKQDAMINIMVDRHSRVFPTNEAMTKAGYADTTETDDNAANAAIRCIGLVYHGTKSIEKTNWNK